MNKARYTQCVYDNCVYIKEKDNLIYLLLYVNDMLIAVRNKTNIQKLKLQLKKEFDMKDLRESNILSIEITQDKSLG